MKKKPLLIDDDLDQSGASAPAAQPNPTQATTRLQTEDKPDGKRSPDSDRQAEAKGDLVPGRDAAGHRRPGIRTGTDTTKASSQLSGHTAKHLSPPVGWLVITAGPGRGSSYGLVSGLNAIGRDTANAVALDHGDAEIEAEAHAYIAYDAKTRLFHAAHGGKTGLVRFNDAPLLVPEQMSAGDHLLIGQTVLRFVPLCGPDFDWADP